MCESCEEWKGTNGQVSTCKFKAQHAPMPDITYCSIQRRNCTGIKLSHSDALCILLGATIRVLLFSSDAETRGNSGLSTTTPF